ncbi:MAG: hypothetical protein ACKOX6_04970 [Bdellovibrio sp.]
MKKSFLAFVLSTVLIHSFAYAQNKCESIFADSTQFASFGFDATVKKVDFSKGHTLDLAKYIQRNLGMDLHDVKRSHDRFVILAGDSQNFQQEFNAEGIRSLTPIKKDYGTHTLSSGIDKNGQKVLVIGNLKGREQVLRSQLLLKACDVPEARIRTLGAVTSSKPEFLNTFKRMGPPPNLVVYGFSGTILKKILALSPLDVTSQLKFQWAAFQKKKMKDTRPEAQEPFYELTLQDGRRVWLLTNVYGEKALHLYEALVEHGVKDILVMGTAGSLNAQYPVGSLITPKEISTDGRNQSSGLSPIAGVPVEGTYSKVLTPLIETNVWLDQQVKSQVDVVDVELGYILAAHKKSPHVNLSAAFLVSDVMVGQQKHDLSNWTTQTLDSYAPRIFSVAQKMGPHLSSWSTKTLKVFYIENETAPTEVSK